MRCLSIANELEMLGATVSFAVADAESVAYLVACGRKAEIVGGDTCSFGKTDGNAVAALCSRMGAHTLLVDSYAVSPIFFSTLRKNAPGLYIAYIDDLFNFGFGRLKSPVRWDVDAIIAYGFGLEDAGFAEVYKGMGTDLLVGTTYAPLRPGFAAGDSKVREHVARVLITTGSTNPNGILESMADSVLNALPNVEIDVIVGALSVFVTSFDQRVHVHHGLTNLAPLMQASDLVVSAAGTTLYELCAVGAPTIAVPIVDNQLPNARGFEASGLGPIVHPGEGFRRRLADAVCELSSDFDRRVRLSVRMRRMVDGQGTIRIAKVLLKL